MGNGEIGDTRGDKGTQGRQEATRGDKTLGKADAPSNEGKQEGRQGETRPLGRRTHHPTKGNKKGKGDKGRQDPREGGHTIQQTETRRCTREQGETKGDKTIGKADTPCNKGKQEGRQGETRPSGRRTHHPPPRRTP